MVIVSARAGMAASRRMVSRVFIVITPPPERGGFGRFIYLFVVVDRWVGLALGGGLGQVSSISKWVLSPAWVVVLLKITADCKGP